MGNLRTNMKKEFRVWIKSIRAYQKQYYNSEATGLRYVGVLNNLTLNPNIEESDCVFEQWTGLYDKNGKKIFEGDILKYDIGLGPLYWVVYMDTKKGMWRITKENGGNTGDWFDQYEVAGNIMENPELLKA